MAARGVIGRCPAPLVHLPPKATTDKGERRPPRPQRSPRGDVPAAAGVVFVALLSGTSGAVMSFVLAMVLAC